MFKIFWENHKVKIIHELGFWLTLAIGFIASDGADVIIALYHGDLSDATLTGLRTLIITSLVKAVLIMLFPQLFPLYRKNEGILPAKEPAKQEVNVSEN